MSEKVRQRTDHSKTEAFGLPQT